MVLIKDNLNLGLLAMDHKVGLFYRAGAYMYLDMIVNFSILTTDNCIF